MTSRCRSHWSVSGLFPTLYTLKTQQVYSCFLKVASLALEPSLTRSRMKSDNEEEIYDNLIYFQCGSFVYKSSLFFVDNARPRCVYVLDLNMLLLYIHHSHIGIVLTLRHTNEIQLRCFLYISIYFNLII